ncbi:Uma2 family endonuclease [Chondromyces apiculatus]|uniref:Uncharacterized protein n=1 Tax=Chondromyces apiculatus DSM 436 TaxID=1192034 RepID=A0A017STK0_9BACT|nr:Uma2 family endonuclease [Chondromyces apiculatus]EYF00328.1 Hypothetical protein CAP_0940 [Chondromyces apiculatus DSM 436]
MPYVWIVEPVARTLEVYRRGLDERWLVIGLHEGTEKVRAEPFDALEIDLALLWKAPVPPASPARPEPSA